MSVGRFRRALVRLYPRAWRDRYGEEFEALLKETPLSPRVTVDVLVAAADAHLRGAKPLNVPTMIENLRRRELIVFVSWIVLAVAGAGFGKITEDPPLSFTRSTPFGTSLFYDAVLVAAVVSALALMVAGVPIALAIARDALGRRRFSQLALLCVPFLTALAWIGLTLLLGTAPSPMPDDLRIILVLVWVGSGLVAVAASCVALAIAATRAQIDVNLYRNAVKPVWLTVIGMAVMTVSVAAWGLAVFVAHPDTFWGDSGVLSTSTALNWLAIVTVAAVATLVAAREVRSIPRDLA